MEIYLTVSQVILLGMSFHYVLQSARALKGYQINSQPPTKILEKALYLKIVG
jgi:hypothetical protein